ncbi:MAG: beta-lactamase family protein [Nannocystis sp.]|nr:serine hydrolase domain-containing protein [Nannocystis sp.]MBA3550008.1 beta-lactamase family protein [Nannocystis sp.]
MRLALPLTLAAACLALACGARDSDCPPAPAAALVATPVTAPAAPAPVPKPERFDVAAIDAYVAAQVERKGFVGLSLAIVRDGEVVLARGYGKASLESGAPATIDTAFAIGSVTKQFTCASALLLAEDGRLTLEDRVATFYPELTRAADISLYDVLSNVSGYPDYYPLDFVDERMQGPIDPDALLRQYASGPLDFDPGTRYSYSNTGFVLAGRVVERLAGEPFAAFLQRRIFAPAGMQRSSFQPAPGTPGLAAGHTSFALGEPTAARPEASGWMHAAGAIYSTATDLARWDLALMQGKLLRPESWRRMITPRTLTTGDATDYGCGVGVARRQGETVVSHSGAVSGFLAWNAMIPRTRSAVILLVNADHVDGATLHGELLSLLIDADRPLPKITGDAPREVALALFKQMQAGTIDRGLLGEAFSRHLGDERLREAAPRLAALGEPTVVVERIGERGGMQVAVLRFNFTGSSARVLLYRSPDGKVQELLLLRD